MKKIMNNIYKKFTNRVSATVMVLLLSTFTLAPSFGLGLVDGALYTIKSENKAFLNALSILESSGDHTKVNTFGYLGKYQFGEVALEATGYYIKDASVRNDWKGKWTGKGGVFSKEDFLNRPYLQDKILMELIRINWDIAQRNGLHKYINKQVHGIKITKAAIIAGMHLKGGLAVKNFLRHNTDSSDGLGTTVSTYMKKLGVHTLTI